MDPEIAVTTIESLPDPLRGRIFAAAGRRAGASAAACPYCCRCCCCCCPYCGHCCCCPQPAHSTLLPSSLQPAVTLVSRRWHRVFFSEPALWRELELTAKSLDEADYMGRAAHWFAAKARLLRRAGGFVQHLQYNEFLDLGPEEEEMVLDMRRVAASPAAAGGWAAVCWPTSAQPACRRCAWKGAQWMQLQQPSCGGSPGCVS